MTKGKGQRAVRPESEDRGAQAGELRRRHQGQGRVAAGDEGIAPNPDANPVEETIGPGQKARTPEKD
ncbi:MAG TPA: hypothetical protein VHM01_17295 [Alphaproteobacteria bacterium]|nr:hypothetical protein [Alphaproteobacteria bacterium]